jgi:hypothetical protein
LIDPLSGAEDAQAATALPRAKRAMPLRSNELALLLSTWMRLATGCSERSVVFRGIGDRIMWVLRIAATVEIV